MILERLPVDSSVLWTVAHGLNHDPHAVLGPHVNGDTVTIRTLRPLADSVVICTPDTRVDAIHEQDGIWVAVLPGSEVPDYRVETAYVDHTDVTDDPYRFYPTLGELDIQLILEGRHEELWRALGSQVRTFPSVMGEVKGTSFAVWAPEAQAVRVIGDFNSWTSGATAMRSLGSSGVWEIFVPGVGPGCCYKYELQTREGHWIQKADPMARRCEVPPATGSVVEESNYTWSDSAWMEARVNTDPHAGPLSIYEVHLGSWQEGLSYRDAATELVEYVKTMGFTHVEFMPLAEHPYAPSWGYQVTGYFAPTSRFGAPDDLRYLIDQLHHAGIGVIMDWVPAHFPKDSFALAKFDGSALYEHPDPKLGEHPDWGTLVFNFGRREVRNFLVANAGYWCEEFHVDGLRVDAVASMLYLDYSRQDGQWAPNKDGGREYLEAIDFLQETTATTYKRYPGIMMIAEESTAWPGVTAPTTGGAGLGFGLKWNMGWMNDTLRYMSEDPINRRWHHGELTFSLVYAFSEHFVLPLSHDEVVHGKGSLVGKLPGDRWQKMAGLRALYAYQWSHPGKQLLFMGSEFGQEAEWASDHSLDWWVMDYPDHAGVASCVRQLNKVYRQYPALWEQDSDPAGFMWIDADDSSHNVLAFLRFAKDGSPLAAVINFAGVPHENYRLALPSGGRWLEVLNTDAEEYGGSGVGNLGAVESEALPWHGKDFSASVRIPPLGAVWFVPDPDDTGQ